MRWLVPVAYETDVVPELLFWTDLGPRPYNTDLEP